MTGSDAVFARRSAVRWRRVGRDAVVVVQDRSQVVGLNPTGAAVLEALDGTRTVDEVVEALAPRWEVPRERLAADVARVLDELAALGVVERAEG
jgi:hypothetical protein